MNHSPTAEQYNSQPDLPLAERRGEYWLDINDRLVLVLSELHNIELAQHHFTDDDVAEIADRWTTDVHIGGHFGGDYDYIVGVVDTWVTTYKGEA